MEKWSAQINKDIDQKLEKAREQDMRFFRIDEFKRNIERVDEFSTNCPACKHEQINIAEAVQYIGEAVHVPGRKRREFDRLIARLSKHMRTEHGFYPPFYFSYVYALFGLIGGAVLGYLLLLFFTNNKMVMFGIGISAGLVVMYVLGSFKDRKIRSQKKLM